MTRKGLEHQLLSIALKEEEPKLESEMNSLVQREEELRLRIIKVEDDLLSTLAKSEGDILENKELLDSYCLHNSVWLIAYTKGRSMPYSKERRISSIVIYNEIRIF